MIGQPSEIQELTDKTFIEFETSNQTYWQLNDLVSSFPEFLLVFFFFFFKD